MRYRNSHDEFAFFAMTPSPDNQRFAVNVFHDIRQS